MRSPFLFGEICCFPANLRWSMMATLWTRPTQRRFFQLAERLKNPMNNGWFIDGFSSGKSYEQYEWMVYRFIDGFSKMENPKMGWNIYSLDNSNLKPHGKGLEMTLRKAQHAVVRMTRRSFQNPTWSLGGNFHGWYGCLLCWDQHIYLNQHESIWEIPRKVQFQIWKLMQKWNLHSRLMIREDSSDVRTADGSGQWLAYPNFWWGNPYQVSMKNYWVNR